MLEYQDIKTFLQKAMFQIGLKFLRFIRLKTVLSRYVISDLKEEEIAEKFYAKELQKTNQKDFRVEKVIKRKCDKIYVKWQGYHSSFDSWIDKKTV